MKNDLQAEIFVFQAFLAEAQERALSNAAFILAEAIATRKLVLARLSATLTPDSRPKRE
jgi:hypothetical protein